MHNPTPDRMGNRTIIDSFRHAFAGLWHALRTQRNTRIHLVIAAIVVALGLWLQISFAEWAVLVLTIGFVLVSEMLNTMAESLVDLITPDYHPHAKIVKDVAAGAVLLGAIIAVLVGLLILGPPLWSRVLGVAQ
jgi:diacylglycerol kinase (ATP)